MMTKWTTQILVIVFAFAVGKWPLFASAVVVLAIGEWQQANETKRAQAAKEKAEYDEYRDGYELGWNSAAVVINNANAGRSNEDVGMKTFDKIGMIEMMARHWCRTAGLANWRGYTRGYADRHGAKDLNDTDFRKMLKASWEEYQS
jgi:hypothetical protein